VAPAVRGGGAVRWGHDRRESILFPGSTFAQGYEPYAVATADGRVLAGLIVRREADELILRDPSGAETRLTRAEIEEVRRSETSVMPEGLGFALSREEVRDLLAFLTSLRGRDGGWVRGRRSPQATALNLDRIKCVSGREVWQHGISPVRRRAKESPREGLGVVGPTRNVHIGMAIPVSSAKWWIEA